MRQFLLIFLIFNLGICSFAQDSTFELNKRNITARIKKIKESTGKVLVDGVKSGTGFYISSNGLILTNWHVVINDKTKKDSKGKILSKFSFVNHKNDTIPLGIALNVPTREAYREATYWDYIVLKTKENVKCNFLKLGNFSDAYEGATVYTCGFPLSLNEPIFSQGLISNLTTQSSQNSAYKRNIAWLDMTTNKGNSGGALMLMTENPENDKVIGITSFIITPYHNELQELKKYANKFEKQYGSSKLMGIDFLKYVQLLSTATNSNSVGISGAISIEKVKNITKNFND